MKKEILISTALIMGLMLTTFSSVMNAQEKSKKPVTEQQLDKKYTCTMHPEVMTDKPGKCPKCGMALVEKTDKMQGEMHHMNDSTMMKHEQMKMMDDQMKMMHDSHDMQKDNMKKDTISMKHNHGCM